MSGISPVHHEPAPAPAPTATVSTGPSWGWFLAWVPVGAAWGLSVVGAMSIGILVAPVAALLTGGLFLLDHGRRGVLGLLSGAGLPFLYVAYLNRGGPGWSCSQDGDTTSCSELFSPLPWLVIAAVLIGGGAVPGRAIPAPDPIGSMTGRVTSSQLAQAVGSARIAGAPAGPRRTTKRTRSARNTSQACSIAVPSRV